MSDLDEELGAIIGDEKLTSKEKQGELKKIFAINQLKKQGRKVADKHLLSTKTVFRCNNLLQLEAPSFAIAMKSFESLTALIEEGYSPDQALYFSIYLQDIASCRYLLTKDANLNFENPYNVYDSHGYPITRKIMSLVNNNPCSKTVNASLYLQQAKELFCATTKPSLDSKEASTENKITYAAILTKFAAACSEDSLFVILYLANCLEDINSAKKPETFCPFLITFTLELYDMMTNPLFPDLESQKNFKDILLPQWLSYSQKEITENQFFSTHEDKQKFLTSIGASLILAKPLTRSSGPKGLDDDLETQEVKRPANGINPTHLFTTHKRTHSAPLMGNEVTETLAQFKKRIMA